MRLLRVQPFVEVLDAVTRAEALSALGVLSLAPDLAREIQWYAFSAEFQVGMYSEAVAREERFASAEARIPQM